VALAENLLIDALPRRDAQHLLAQCDPVRLAAGEPLAEAGRPTRHVYFPTTGMLALLTPIDGHPDLEIGLVGCEGMLGEHCALGISAAPWRARMLTEGTAQRMAASSFRSEVQHSAALRRGVYAYLHLQVRQLARAVACQHFHLLGPRLARWLLMSQDRAADDQFHVTHESLAGLLGVRRVGITMAAGELQRHGLIAYHRGTLRVLDRAGLEAAACSCYAADRGPAAALWPVRQRTEEPAAAA